MTDQRSSRQLTTTVLGADDLSTLLDRVGCHEVMDLMIRRELSAVPVVGEGYVVLGVVTTEDALRHLLAAERIGESAELTARDLMTRQVLCVSEDQELRDVAQLMISRGAAQLPVVREGQFVGFVTRDSALATLGGGEDDDRQEHRRS